MKPNTSRYNSDFYLVLNKIVANQLATKLIDSCEYREILVANGTLSRFDGSADSAKKAYIAWEKSDFLPGWANNLIKPRSCIHNSGK